MRIFNKVHVGFTGTRQGMSLQQRDLMRWMIAQFKEIETFHHGDAVGADRQAEAIVEQFIGSTFMGSTSRRIVAHPAGDDPLKRDKEIVAAVDVLIAAPAQDKEILRSGTWATIRYARAKGIPVIMLPRGR